MGNENTNKEKPKGICACCSQYRELSMSHAIPRSAFMPIMKVGSGSAIGIPDREGNAHLTSDTGEAPLLCAACEGEFNRQFDGPLANALKTLENEILLQGVQASIEFSADQIAHAVVSIAWRVNRSPAPMYSGVKLHRIHELELDRLLKLPAPEVLKHCSVRVARLVDPSADLGKGFRQAVMGQFIKTPQIYTVRTKRRGKSHGFGMDWTMFGFLINLVVPRLTYPKSKSFGGLKPGQATIQAVPTDVLEYAPLGDALLAGYAAHAEGRMTPALKRRSSKQSG